MIVREDPSLLALDVGVSGTASAHVHDFWRPLGHREAQVDGHYSVQCYLDALASAYRGWRERARRHRRLARVCYHVPFCKMAKKAHAHHALGRARRGRTSTPRSRRRWRCARASATSTRARCTSRSPGCSTRRRRALAGARDRPVLLRQRLHQRVLLRPVSPRAAERDRRSADRATCSRRASGSRSPSTSRSWE